MYFCSYNSKCCKFGGRNIRAQINSGIHYFCYTEYTERYLTEKIIVCPDKIMHVEYPVIYFGDEYRKKVRIDEMERKVP